MLLAVVVVELRGWLRGVCLGEFRGELLFEFEILSEDFLAAAAGEPGLWLGEFLAEFRGELAFAFGDLSLAEFLGELLLVPTAPAC